MAELAVRMHFLNDQRHASLALMKYTFPLWGVAAPISSLCFAVPAYFELLGGDAVKMDSLMHMLTGGALLFVFLISLLIVHWLSRDAVVVDKDGLHLPFSLLRWHRSYPWDSIKAIKVTNPGTNWRKRNLAIVTRRGVSKLSLGYFEPESLEKMILAIEMWGKQSGLDPGLLELKTEAAAAEINQLSYTAMWEEELTRRFNPTAFVPLEPGRFLRNGTLKVVRHLALGGLSAVYLCQQDQKKLVVLKEAVVSDDATESAQAKAREMLEREATMLLKLKHQNIVTVLDHFVEQGRNYLMLDYINGQDLRQLVKQNGPQPERVILTWAVQMATILKYLHEQDPPVIHRDFTPDNLVLCEGGSVVLIDFGAANEFISNATGTFVGKHSYIAPEQFRGKAVVQSDLYAFGCTLYFLVTGLEPEALSTSNPANAKAHVSPDLCQLIETCTQMDAKDRYQSAAQLIPILRGLAASISAVT